MQQNLSTFNTPPETCRISYHSAVTPCQCSVLTLYSLVECVPQITPLEVTSSTAFKMRSVLVHKYWCDKGLTSCCYPNHTHKFVMRNLPYIDCVHPIWTAPSAFVLYLSFRFFNMYHLCSDSRSSELYRNVLLYIARTRFPVLCVCVFKINR